MNVTPDALWVSAAGRWGRGVCAPPNARGICIQDPTRSTPCGQRRSTIRDSAPGGPSPLGTAGRLASPFQGRLLAADWMVVLNRLWAHGRVFLRCSRCGHRVTRLYLVTLESARLECRRCLGLTYWSRTHSEYRRRGGWLDTALGVTPADWARLHGSEERRAAKAAARVRYQELRAHP